MVFTESGAAMLPLEILVGLAVVVGVGIYAFHITSGRRMLSAAAAAADQLRENARREAETKSKEIALAAAQEQMKFKEQAEREQTAIRRKLEEHESRLATREDTVDRKLDTLSVKEKRIDEAEGRLAAKEKSVTAKDEQLTQVLREERERLLQVANMSPEQAKEMLLKRIEDECRHDAGELIRRITDEAEETAKEKSRMIILQAIQRYAADQTADHTVSSVNIPSDDMKGRVIGREGRNIRSFEKSTGVDVIIDDTPGLVVVSCFDPVRREVARISLDRLGQDGRIPPARIEEVGAATSKEMEEELIRVGKEAATEANLQLPKPIIPMLGRLAYRTSYG